MRSRQKKLISKYQPSKYKKQAGAELGQAQHKLGFDSTLIFFKFGFYRSSKKIEENHPFGSFSRAK